MSKGKADTSINPKLVDAVDKMLERLTTPAADGEEIPLADQLGIIREAARVEALRLKITGDEEGSAFRRTPRED